MRVQLAINNRGQRKVFTFDRVFDGEATQEAVYEDTKPLIRSVLDGARLPPFQARISDLYDLYKAFSGMVTILCYRGHSEQVLGGYMLSVPALTAPTTDKNTSEGAPGSALVGIVHHHFLPSTLRWQSPDQH